MSPEAATVGAGAIIGVLCNLFFSDAHSLYDLAHTAAAGAVAGGAVVALAS